MDRIRLALDKSHRHYDADGRLHVAVNNISKAAVNPYLGHEIPDYEKHGLDPYRTYYLFRDPDELARAAPTFNGLPLLDRHIPVNVDAPQKEFIVGALGTDAEFVAPYLRNSLVVWTAEAIAAIESEDQEELSCGYRYEPDMTPGEWDGLRYDGIMRSIVGNHVALVEAGRAGPDVIVGDSQVELVTMALKVRKALEKIARDTAVDIDHVVKVINAMSGNEAAEAEGATDDGEIYEPEFESEETPAGGDLMAKVMEFLKGKISDDDMAELSKMVSGVNGADPDAPDAPAMDAAMIAATVTRKLNAIRTAERDVEPVIGPLAVTMDSAAAIYRFALDHMKIDTKGVHPSALGALFRQAAKPAQKTPIGAYDAQSSDDFAKRFPAAARVKTV